MKRTILPVSLAALNPKPTTGWYFFHASPGSAATGTFASGVFRVSAFVVSTAMTLDRIGVEVATIGDAGSLLRLGIYADNGNAAPGSKLLDAGTVAGDSATTQTITISQALTPGVYWMGAVGQNVTTTAPTLRIVGSTWVPPVPMAPSTTSLPSANATLNGYVQTGVTGALPSTFTVNSVTTSSPRMVLRVT